MDKFKNKYRIASARLQNWDYGSPGLYFITICTKNRECYFGEILETDVVDTPCMAYLRANKIGQIAETEWLKTPELRPDMNIELGEFVVMPNHFHGIIIIGKNKYNNDCRDAMHGISTTTIKTTTKNKFGPQIKNLGSIIRGFKSSVTTFATKNNIVFGWQERFHDHIIRNHDEYLRISNYIINNPANWGKDKFFK